MASVGLREQRRDIWEISSDSSGGFLISDSLRSHACSSAFVRNVIVRSLFLPINGNCFAPVVARLSYLTGWNVKLKCGLGAAGGVECVQFQQTTSMGYVSQCGHVCEAWITGVSHE